MIDIGLNLTSDKFAKDRKEIIESALKNNVSGFILTGTSLKASKEAYELVKSNTDIMVSTAGVHPHDAKNWHRAKQEIEKLANQKGVVAIGECGLDYDRMFSSRDEQMTAFREQLELAIKYDKPVFLHVRPKIGEGEVKKIMDDFNEIFEPYHKKGIKGIVHCFTGNKKMLDTFLGYSLYIGITGWVCDEKRGEQLQKLIKYIPDDKLMIETDAPYLTPANMENKTRRNEPAFLVYVAKKVADLKDISVEKLSAITDDNVSALFNWKPKNS